MYCDIRHKFFFTFDFYLYIGVMWSVMRLRIHTVRWQHTLLYQRWRGTQLHPLWIAPWLLSNCCPQNLIHFGHEFIDGTMVAQLSEHGWKYSNNNMVYRAWLSDLSVLYSTPHAGTYPWAILCTCSRSTHSSNSRATLLWTRAAIMPPGAVYHASCAYTCGLLHEIEGGPQAPTYWSLSFVCQYCLK